MPIDFDALKSQPRILFEVPLKPVMGSRIQPTGFPDLGPATYDAPDGKDGTVPTLLVESAQSMANRLEAVCWDEAAGAVAPELDGLPNVQVLLKSLGDDTTNSLLEFHRLNSPYIMSGTVDDGRTFHAVLSKELNLSSAKSDDTGKEAGDVAGVVNLRRLAAVCFKYDPNSLVHGVFLEKIAGRLRHPRALSSFIEATGVGRADSGGVKFDRALPKPSAAGVDAKGGYGNVPFHRTEFTAQAITAYFSIDLAQLRGYGLGEDATRLLIALSLWKIRSFLDSTMRLRTACELEVVGDYDFKATRPTPPKGETFILGTAAELAAELKGLIGKCKPKFATPAQTVLTWTGDKAAKKPKAEKPAKKGKE